MMAGWHGLQRLISVEVLAAGVSEAVRHPDYSPEGRLVFSNPLDQLILTRED